MRAITQALSTRRRARSDADDRQGRHGNGWRHDEYRQLAETRDLERTRRDQRDRQYAYGRERQATGETRVQRALFDPNDAHTRTETERDH